MLETAYIDSSVLLRKVLGEPRAAKEFSEVQHYVASEIIQVECLRILHRLRISGSLTDQQLADRAQLLRRAFLYFELIEINRAVLDRAAEPFPTVLGTLDAIHLASALLWKRQRRQELALLTHDVELGRAARASGLEVFGI